MANLTRGAGGARDRNDANKILTKQMRKELIAEHGGKGRKFLRLGNQIREAVDAGNKKKVKRKFNKFKTVYKSMDNVSDSRDEFKNFKKIIRQYLRGNK